MFLNFPFLEIRWAAQLIDVKPSSVFTGQLGRCYVRNNGYYQMLPEASEGLL